MEFIIIIGAPSVGKMTVGQTLCKLKNYTLFHNHHSIEFALNFFPFDSKEFETFNKGIRGLFFDTIAGGQLTKGIVFTMVCKFNIEEDIMYLKNLISLFKKKDYKTVIVELTASWKTRNRRNITDYRLLIKPSKRDIPFSKAIMIEMENKFRMFSKKEEQNMLAPDYFIVIDNEKLNSIECAMAIIQQLDRH